jgi:hypothetical protein
MRSRRTWIALGLALVPAVAIPFAAVAMSGGTPSFTRSVAPIIAEKCAGCHQAGGIAPFPLETAKQISSRAALIGAAVQARVMPPWPPGKSSPAYAGQAARTLTAQQRATIVAWAARGGKVDGPARKAAAQQGPEVRSGETLLDLRMQTAYKPSAPKGATDDYRCFLLDPQQTGDRSVTSVRIEPGQPKVVHHVILFRVPQTEVPSAKDLDRKDAAAGWSCFGGTGLSAGTGAGLVDSLNDANWIAAWAPGWGGNRLPEGTGVELPAKSQIVMQVHYNLLNGNAPDRSRALLTVAPASAGLEARARCALRSKRGALRPRPEVRDRSRLHTCRPPHPLSRQRLDSGPEPGLDLRPPDLDPDDDPRCCGPHAPPRCGDPPRAQSGHVTREGAARHPALGLPLAERLHPCPLGEGRAQ